MQLRLGDRRPVCCSRGFAGRLCRHGRLGRQKAKYVTTELVDSGRWNWGDVGFARCCHDGDEHRGGSADTLKAGHVSALPGR